MDRLLRAFKGKTGYGALCNTSLNFKGTGFINKGSDLARYVKERKLDGFVAGQRCYFLTDSERYSHYLQQQVKTNSALAQ